MIVYELDHDSTFKHLIPVDEDKERYDDLTGFQGRWFYGKPHAEGWIPPKAIFNPVHKRRKKSDCPPFMLRAETLSGRVVEALGDVLQMSGELLPIRCDEGEYFIHNVTNSPDNVLDMDNSDFHKSANGEYILHIRKYAFYTEKLDNLWVFKLPQNRNTRVYVTELFKDAVEAAGLTGFKFVPLQTNDEGQTVSVPALKPEVTETALSNDDIAVIKGAADEAAEYLRLTGQETPKDVVRHIASAVMYLREHPLVKDEESRHAAMLGALFGEQVVRTYGWSWAQVGDDERMAYAVVTPDKSIYIEPLQFVWQFLLDKEKDSTVLLLFNMLAKPQSNVRAGAYQQVG